MSHDDKPDSKAVEFEGAEDILKGRFEGMPFESPVQPQQIGLDDEIQFGCHPGISCFNECCRNIDIQLLPYDIMRLKAGLGMDSKEFVARHTMPFEMDHHGLPGLKLATKPGTRECVFLGEEGCTVYGDRPTACRYYAVGSMTVRPKDSATSEDAWFMVKEPHCKGHEEDRRLTVGQYREEQGLEIYDRMNREWRDIIIKKRSAGPTVGAPSTRSLQLFDMCSYDMDSFREFIQTPGFMNVFDLSGEERASLLEVEDKLLAFAMRFLKQVLFGEQTIPVKEGAREQRLDERREVLSRRKHEQVEQWQQSRDIYEQDADAEAERLESGVKAKDD